MKKYQLFLVREIATPILRRAGTAFAAYLVAKGATSADANIILTGLTAACGVAFDLLNSHFERRGR